ncbi:MAG: type II toxin-antitoxin system VapC family toxin [Gammaproteobacteria bacterium]|nr:type II toxin-antitoxin system VapC family toxin [Gammaproteobacteria bacterium]
MRAIDTNVVVRYIIGDDAKQSARARAVIDSGSVFVSTTVVLESEWVLRSVYGFDRDAVVNSLRAFLGLPSISAENPHLLMEALDRAEKGMDFADALHLGAAVACEAMLTFDRRFILVAADQSPRVAAP